MAEPLGVESPGMTTTGKIIPMPRRPRVFTKHEDFIEQVREAIFACGIPYRKIAIRAKVSENTVSRLANGYTKWPRHTTLFPVLEATGHGIALVQK